MSPESGSREREHREQTKERRSWWRCVPVAEATQRESEAVERFAEALVRAVDGLPTWDKRSVPGGKHVNRAAVLAAISALRSPADTGEHQEGDVGS